MTITINWCSACIKPFDGIPYWDPGGSGLYCSAGCALGKRTVEVKRAVAHIMGTECHPTEGTEPRQCAGCTAMIPWEPERAFCVYCEHRINLEAASGDYMENLALSEPLEKRIAAAQEPVEEHAWATATEEWP